MKIDRVLKYTPVNHEIDDMERLRDVPPLLPFFKGYINHKGVSELHDNTAYFFCDFTPAIGGDSLNVIRTFNITIPMNLGRESTARTFLDKQVSIGHNPSSVIEAIEIKVNNTHCGFYIPIKNILLATDWSHNLATIDVLKNTNFITDLVRELSLKPYLDSPAKKKMPKADVTIGCDPEYEMEISGRPVNASDYVSTTTYNEGCIGLDGAGYQVELRPKASKDIDVLCNNIKVLVGKFNNLYNATLLTSGNRYPLGGHIHFGGVRADHNFITLLDDTIGKLFSSTSGRARGSYRRFGAYEAGKSHGGFEYRTPPASIFVDPEICHLVLSIAKRLADRFYSGEEIAYSCSTRGVTLKTLSKLTGIPVKNLKCIPVFKKAWRSGYNLTPVEYAWCGIKPRMLNIGFNDFCATPIREKLTRLLSEALEPVLTQRLHVSIFGLRAERGDYSIAGFTAPGFEVATDLVVNSNSSLGVSYRLRSDEAFFNSNCEAIVSRMIKHLQESYPDSFAHKTTEAGASMSSVI